MPLEPHLRPQPVAQDMMELLPRRPVARRVEPRFAVDRIEQRIERPLEPWIAKVVEAGVLDGARKHMILYEVRRRHEAQFATRAQRGVQRADKRRAARGPDSLLVQFLPLLAPRYRAKLPLAPRLVPALRASGASGIARAHA